MASRFLVPLGRGGDPLLSIYREMNRMFDDVLGGGFGGSGRQGGAMSMPSLDVHEKDFTRLSWVQLGRTQDLDYGGRRPATLKLLQRRQIAIRQ